jgi:hypothetical protein
MSCPYFILWNCFSSKHFNEIKGELHKPGWSFNSLFMCSESHKEHLGVIWDIWIRSASDQCAINKTRRVRLPQLALMKKNRLMSDLIFTTQWHFEILGRIWPADTLLHSGVKGESLTESSWSGQMPCEVPPPAEARAQDLWGPRRPPSAPPPTPGGWLMAMAFQSLLSTSGALGYVLHLSLCSTAVKTGWVPGGGLRISAHPRPDSSAMLHVKKSSVR